MQRSLSLPRLRLIRDASGYTRGIPLFSGVLFCRTVLGEHPNSNLVTLSSVGYMKLIASLTSPYVRKVRIVMADKKLDYELQLENVWAPDTKAAQYNPLGKVPCLINDDDTPLYDSRVIVEYLDTLSPVSHLIPKTGRERAIVKCWEALADGTLDAAIIIVKELQRPAEQQSQEWIDRQYGKIHAALAAMENDLGTQSYCMGVGYSLADVAVGVLLGYLDFRFPQISWRDNAPNLARLYAKLSLRQSFIDTVPVVS